MPIFGKRSQAYELTGRERPGIGGQVLNQIGMNLFGVDVEGMKLNRAMAEKQREFMAQLAGRLRPEYAPTNNELTVGLNGEGNASTWSPEASINPVRTADPLNINSPELALIRMQGDQLGYDMSGITDVLKAQQPDWKIGPDGRPYNAKASGGLPERFGNPTNVEGTIVDLYDPENLNRVIPKAPVNGAMPVYDNRGRTIDWTMPKGALAAITSAAGADSGGRAAGSAPYDFIRVEGPDGRPMTISKSQAVGGVFPGQAPDDARYGAAVAEADATRFEGIIKGGENARAMEGSLTRMSQLLDGLNTGRLTPAGRELASLATSFGIEVAPEWGNIEAADAIANKLALDFMGGSLGAGFSNADRDFVRSITPQVASTPQGRKLLIDFGIKKAQRDQETASRARAWQQRFGRLDRPDGTGRNFYEYLDAHAAANPLVPPRR